MAPAISIQLNGKQRSVPGVRGPVALDALLAALEVQADRVAVELNGEIVARRNWPASVVSEGDRLEIVHFVGGGSGFWSGC